jgi:hypothetical protein
VQHGRPCQVPKGKDGEELSKWFKDWSNHRAPWEQLASPAQFIEGTLNRLKQDNAGDFLAQDEQITFEILSTDPFAQPTEYNTLVEYLAAAPRCTRATRAAVCAA